MKVYPRRPPVEWLVCVFLGCALTVTAFLAVLLVFVLPPSVLGPYAVVVAGVALVALMLGGALIVVGVRGWHSKPGVPVTTRWGWLVLTVFLAALVGFTFLIPRRFQSSPFIAPLHFGMIVLPAFIGLLLIIRLSGKNWIPTVRQLVVSLAGGAASVLIALPLELIGFVLIAVLVIGAAMVFPGGQAEVDNLLSTIQLWTVTPPAGIESISALVTSPVVMVSLVLILACMTPIIEELVKTLVMGPMGLWMRPGMGLSFIWGVSCGLGFAIVEGITNGSLGLTGEGWWIGGVFARLFATLMHAASSGILGLGWSSLWSRKWWGIPLTYAGAVILHGLWNLSALILVYGSLLITLSELPGTVPAVIGGGMMLVMVLLVVTSLIVIPLWMKRRVHVRPQV
ncbi:MAG: hypothetical protein P1S60_00960 [Anaerolineae bacterium]|nr:hypothetical protein [Anaerolineae bacterium]